MEVNILQEDCLKWIASRIEDLRESKGVSAREMSRNIDKEETYIRKIETGKITPKPILSSMFRIKIQRNKYQKKPIR